MKQIIQSYKTGKMELRDVPTPLCQENGILLKTARSLISAGTEKLMIDLARKNILRKAQERPDLVEKVLDKVRQERIIETAKNVFTKLDKPISLGYSCSGTVVEVGKNISKFKVGDRVACGGTGYASHTEINFVPKNLCVKIPDSVNFESAAFTTVGAIAMQGVRRCQLEPGEWVGVIGLGLIGQLTVQILRAYGFLVLGIDINESKVQKCFNFGMEKGAVIGKDKIQQIADAFSDGHGLDAVIITASTQSNQPVELAGQLCRQNGRVCAVGLVGMQINRELYYKKELDFRISRSYGPGRYDVNYEEKGIDYPYEYVHWTENRNMQEFLRLASINKINLDQMITHKFRIEDYKKAYQLVLENLDQEDVGGVLFEYQEQPRQESIIKFKTRTQIRTNEKQVTAAIIGAGNFAKRFILPNLVKLDVKIKAITTAQGMNAEHLAQKYKCDYCTTDYQKILDDNEINTVFIATRHNQHAPMAKQALDKGKRVFLEKPLCIKETELKMLSNHPRISNLIIGYNRRFAPTVIKVKNQLKNQAGPLMVNYRINAGYIPKEHWVHDPKIGGGRIIGEVCHFVDLLQFLTTSKPTKVFVTRLPVQGDILGDDNLDIIIEFSDGSRSNVFYTAMGDNKVSKEYVEIFANKQTWVINDFKTEGLFKKQDKGHFNELREFIKVVESNQAMPIPTEQILLSSLTTFKIIDSINSGQPVEISLNQL